MQKIPTKIQITVEPEHFNIASVQTTVIFNGIEKTEKKTISYHKLLTDFDGVMKEAVEEVKRWEI